MANPDYPLMPVQDGAAIISNTRGLYKMTEFNAYGLVMNKQIISALETVNGHTTRTVHIESVAQNVTLFLQTAQKFLEKVSFGGPLYFRLKISNTRALRALFQKKKATVLEDYVRMDRTIYLADLQTDFTRLLTEITREAAWALGTHIDDKTLQKLAADCTRGLV